MSTSERTPLLVNRNDDTKPETPSSPVGLQEFSFKSVDRRKKFVLISLGFVNFCASCCFSLLAPFFPIEVSIICHTFSSNCKYGCDITSCIVLI